jgi:lysophospholipase L1-like esterase
MRVSPTRHSERSEESKWRFATPIGFEKPLGSFATLRMTVSGLGVWAGILLLSLTTAQVVSAKSGIPELHVRTGLPNVAARAAAGGELRVAYLGGSITAATDGWRSLTTDHLRARFPQLTITEIPAGLPGTGSNLGACRVGYDVLRRRPDLLFVEFAVNDLNAPPERIEQTMEGIVRQVWRANPLTDIIFVYTISTPGLPDLQAGRFPAAARAMENVAAHYGIPSLHFGVEVARRLAAGELVFKAPETPGEARTFSLDGVHPTAAGHRVYFAALERALPALLVPAGAAPHALPTPLQANNWEQAGLRLLDHVARQGEWTAVPLDDPNLRGAMKHLLPPLLRTASPGSTLEFGITGPTFGLLGIAAPDSGQFQVTVDDLPPVTGTFFDSFVSPTFCRAREWFYPGVLAAGPHRVRVELLGPAPDKAAIKAKAGRPMDDPAPYAPSRLTLGGVLTVFPPP